MTRLQREWHRLYVPEDADATAPADPDTAPPPLVGADGQVRAAVLAVSGSGGWSALSPAWQGVQADLDLPAPAIAVAGPAGHQLWFSFGVPLPAAQARAFVESLRQRYLGEVPAHRITAWPAPDATRSPPWRPAEPVPVLLAGGERWSAFVAPDLAPMFSDDPWLDLPPSPEGQAELLSRLKCITAVELQRALQRLQGPAPASAAAADAPASAAPQAAVNSPPAGTSTAGPWTEPMQFLLAVMNDSSVPLALRIEAAKALLPHADAVRRPEAPMPPLPG